MWGNERRREFLQYKWFFTCNCARCSDPTELGSHISSVKCKHCAGMVVPPNDESGSPWSCSTCHKTVSEKAVDATLNLLANSFAKISNTDVRALHRAAIVVDKILGPQIYLSITYKHQIVQLIMEKHTEECSLSELWCVVDLTKLLLDVASRLAPGLSYLKGDMLYKHVRAALEILLRAKQDTSENLGMTEHNIRINGDIEGKKEITGGDDDTYSDDIKKNTSRNDHNKNSNINNNLLPKDSRLQALEERLKFRWKELNVKILLQWTKEAQEILKYTSFYAKEIILDTAYVMELFRELLQTDV